jgi:disulfide bond formation protein DsbB
MQKPSPLQQLVASPVFIPMVMLESSTMPLFLALISQYGFGLHPCELCIWQRVPYVALIVLAGAAVAFMRRPVVLRRLLQLSIVLWFVEAALAFYHVGVEQQWWDSVTGCSGGGSVNGSLDDLKAQILSSPVVSCGTPEFVFMGLSMAGWNLVYAVVMLGFMMKLEAKHGAARR